MQCGCDEKWVTKFEDRTFHSGVNACIEISGVNYVIAFSKDILSFTVE